ncbi:MAG: hypothetical protein GF330_06090 [Candidatus Eisenbacteria bacterium]|nr:hypothetical protein [Candidatus Eisenbacteria bacterium]
MATLQGAGLAADAQSLNLRFAMQRPHDDGAWRFHGGRSTDLRAAFADPELSQDLVERLGGPFWLAGESSAFEMRPEFGVGLGYGSPLDRAWRAEVGVGLLRGEARGRFPIGAEAEADPIAREGTLETDFTRVAIEGLLIRQFHWGRSRPFGGAGLEYAYVTPDETQARLAGRQFSIGSAEAFHGLSARAVAGLRFHIRGRGILEAAVTLDAMTADSDAGGNALRWVPGIRLAIALPLGGGTVADGAMASDPAWRPRVGEALHFEIELENPTPRPWVTTLYDPVPLGCRRLILPSIEIRGAPSHPRNASTETMGLLLEQLVVPPHGRLLVRLAYEVAAHATDGAQIVNDLYASGQLVDRAATPAIEAGGGGAAGRRVSKRYRGRETVAHARRPADSEPTEAQPPARPPPELPPGEPGEPPPETPPREPPPEKPPGVPPPEGACDCCCHALRLWDAGDPIQVEIISPIEERAIPVALGETLAFAVDAVDRDRMQLRCLKEACGKQACPECAAQRMVTLPGRVGFAWELVSGAGALRTRPPLGHRHSARERGPAALYEAPTGMPADPTVVIRLTVDDDWEYLAGIDDRPQERTFLLRLVSPSPQEDRGTSGAGEPSGAGIPPGAGARGSLTPASPPAADGGLCDCQPSLDWQPGSPFFVSPAAPETLVVCAGHHLLLEREAFDRDRLVHRCIAPDCVSPPAPLPLNDRMRYRWRATRGRILGSARRVVYRAPEMAGFVRVETQIDDSGLHPGAADEPERDAAPLTVEIFRIARLELLEPFAPARDNRFLYQLRIEPAGAVRAEIRNRFGDVERHLDHLPVRANDTDGTIRIRWDGLTDSGAKFHPAHAPLTLHLYATKRGTTCHRALPLDYRLPWEGSHPDSVRSIDAEAPDSLPPEGCGSIAGRIVARGRFHAGRLIAYIDGENCHPCGISRALREPVVALGGAEKVGGFDPSTIHLTLGETAIFRNAETLEISHQPYILPGLTQRGPAHEMGLLAPGERAKFRPAEPGQYTAHCEWHRREDARLFVLPNRCYAIADSDGNYRIDNVPAGTYRLRTMHSPPRGHEADARVTVRAGETTREDLKISAARSD